MLENPTVYLKTLRLVCEFFFFVWVDIYIYLCGEEHATSGERIISCVHTSFVNFAVHPTPQTKI